MTTILSSRFSMGLIPVAGTRPSLLRCGQAYCAAAVLLGYVIAQRSFAYWGVPPLYIGEILLLIFLLTGPMILFGPWLRSLLVPSPLSPFAWAFYFSAFYGGIQCLRGLSGDLPMITLQNFAFHVYPIFLFVGIFLGHTIPNFVPRFIRWVGWLNGIYGILYLFLLARWIEPNSEDVPIFGTPAGSALWLLGVLCFEKQLSRQWMPLLMNTFVLLALQVRAEWFGLVVALVLWAVMAGRVRQVAKLTIVASGLLMVAWLVDLRVSSPSTHAGEISAEHIVGRAFSTFDSKSPQGDEADESAATVTWRTAWWAEIWREAHKTPLRATFGPGYGFHLWELHPEQLTYIVRMPHNIFLYALGYTGWVGVLGFVALQAALARALFAVYRRDGDPFGLIYWTFMLTRAMFENWLEAPFGAIPLFLITGVYVSRLVCNRANAITAEMRGPNCTEMTTSAAV